MNSIPDKPSKSFGAPKIFAAKDLSGKESKPLSIGEIGLGLFGLTARPRELTRNQKTQGPQDELKTAKLGEKIAQVPERGKDKNNPLEALFRGRRNIRKKEYLGAFGRATSDQLVKEYGISKRLVNTKRKRWQLGMQVAGYKKGEMPGHIGAKPFRREVFKLNRDPRGLHNEIAEKLYNEGRKSGWQATRTQKDILKDMLKKEKGGL